MKWQITSAMGEDMGTYEAEDEEKALDEMARAAGYRDYAETLERGVSPFQGTIEEMEENLSPGPEFLARELMEYWPGSPEEWGFQAGRDKEEEGSILLRARWCAGCLHIDARWPDGIWDTVLEDVEPDDLPAEWLPERWI